MQLSKLSLINNAPALTDMEYQQPFTNAAGTHGLLGKNENRTAQQLPGALYLT
jgi:hypothetical protein